MRTQGRILALCALLIIVISCKKKIGGDIPEIPPPDLSNRQNRIAEITKEVSEILEQVYENGGAYNEVNAAIYSGYYEDERVLLKDLLFPLSSELYKSESFKQLKVDTGIFRKKFCEILEHGDYPLLSEELRPTILGKTKATTSVIASDVQIMNEPGVSVLSATQPISIYFPYSENFPNIQVNDSLPANSKMAIVKRPTIVYSDREADSAPGREPYYCPGQPNNLCYRNVMVDDDFAEIRPTHIVTIGANVKEFIGLEPLKTELVNRIYHGSSRLTRQMDKLISFTGNGGGSEIKVCRINGYLKKTDEHITDFAGDVVSLQYTRGDIRKRKWKRVFSVWDPNWNYQDIEQIYAVYEEDNIGSKTINGSLTTAVSLPGKLGKVDGSVGFKIEVWTQDDIITQRKLDRKSYFRDGLNNQGWGYLSDTNDFLSLRSDWPIFDGGSIWQYTLPYRIF